MSLMKAEAVSIIHTLLQQLLSPHAPLPSGEVQPLVVSGPTRCRRKGRGPDSQPPVLRPGPEAFLDVSCLVSSRVVV